jgi:hypothetical protein
MLPRLQAEEAISGANATALGTGSLDKIDAGRLSAKWTRTASGAEARAPKATPDTLAPMGIGVRQVQKAS